MTTSLPLELRPGDRVAFVGNTLLERSQHFGYFEALLHRQFPDHQLVVRNLCWSADTPSLQPRPANFADLEQHLTRARIDVVFAAYGFNESFDGGGRRRPVPERARRTRPATADAGVRTLRRAAHRAAVA